jgi:hypothetical protein
MIEKVITTAQILSALLMASDYFVSKEKLTIFEAKLKKRLKQVLPTMSKEYETFAVVIVLGLTSFVVNHYGPDYWTAHMIPETTLFWNAILLIGIAGALSIIPLIWLLGLWLRFMIFCPKGVIAASVFPIFLAATALQIYKLF